MYHYYTRVTNFYTHSRAKKCYLGVAGDIFDVKGLTNPEHTSTLWHFTAQATQN